MEEIKVTFGKIIADARKKAGLSQKDLAAKIKKEDGEQISPQYLNDIEHDRRNPPSEFLITQFAKELKLSKEYLILTAGTLPQDIQKKIAVVDPEIVDEAYKVFRRTIREKE